MGWPVRSRFSRSGRSVGQKIRLPSHPYPYPYPYPCPCSSQSTRRRNSLQATNSHESVPVQCSQRFLRPEDDVSGECTQNWLKRLDLTGSSGINQPKYIVESASLLTSHGSVFRSWHPCYLTLRPREIRTRQISLSRQHSNGPYRMSPA